MIDAVEIAESISYERQNDFEYRDKAGKKLARVLSEHPVKHKVTPMILRVWGHHNEYRGESRHIC